MEFDFNCNPSPYDAGKHRKLIVRSRRGLFLTLRGDQDSRRDDHVRISVHLFRGRSVLLSDVSLWRRCEIVALASRIPIRRYIANCCINSQFYEPTGIRLTTAWQTLTAINAHVTSRRVASDLQMSRNYEK